MLLIKNNRTANILFGLFLLLFSTIHLQHLALQTGFLKTYPYIDPVCGISICLSFPVFLFYVKSLTGNFQWGAKSNWLHFPILLAPVGNLFYLLAFKNADELREYYYIENDHFSPTNVLLLAGMVLYLLVYLLLSLKEVSLYTEKLKDTLSYIEKARLRWLYQLIILLIILAAVIAPVLIIQGLPEWNRIVMGVYTSIMYLMIMYKTIHLQKNPPPLISYSKDESSKVHILSPEKEENYYHKLIDFIKKEKPYLQADLSLKELAESLSIPSYSLSYLINKRFQNNFFDFINLYRVEQAKQLLSNSVYNKFTIEALGKESGFGSKTAFNRAFKVHTGQTPTAYRKNEIEFIKKSPARIFYKRKNS